MITLHSPAFAIPFGTLSATHLDIVVRHDKAGMRGIDWRFHESGHRLSFTPVARANRMRRSILMATDQFDSGFYIRLDAATRKNPHAIARAMAAIGDHRSDLRDAYADRDLERLRSITDRIAAQATKR
jgi:hypothetical protein